MAREVPIVRTRTTVDIETLAGGILLRHSPRTLSGQTAFSVLEFIDGPLQDEYKFGFSVQDLGPNKEGKLENRTLILNTPVYQGLVNDKSRDRFTGSHEIGHALMHSDELDAINDGSRGRPALYRREHVKPWQDPEWQANAFAAAILMPVDGVLARLASFRHLMPALAADVLSSTFLVSPQAAKYRVDNLVKRGILKL